MEARRNVMFNKAGGNASKNAMNCRLSLPMDMVRALGVTMSDREVVMTCVDNKIIIEKARKE
jgi:hypothetical protein